jgi:hypothetical protein
MLQIPAEPPVMAAQSASVSDDAKASLGLSYLQTLASQAAFACSLVGRHADGAGVDVRFEIHEKLDPQARMLDFSLDFQLRATSRGLPIVDSKLLFTLETERYEMLRIAVSDRPRFIVLLSLPSDLDGGDALSVDDLVANRRGRWLCLSGAPQASNSTATPVRFPTWNVLTPTTLREIARRISLGSRFFHEQ